MSAATDAWRAATDNVPAEDWWGAPIIAAGDDLLAALEASDRHIAELEEAVEYQGAMTKALLEAQSRYVPRIAELEAALAGSFADVTGTVPSSWYLEIKTKHDALAAALEAAEVEKAHLTKVATEYQDALAARDRRIAELEAGVREAFGLIPAAIQEPHELIEPIRAVYRVLRRFTEFANAPERPDARDLLAGRATGGEG